MTQQKLLQRRFSIRRHLFLITIMFIPFVLLFSYYKESEYWYLGKGKQNTTKKKKHSKNGFITKNGIIVPDWNPSIIWDQQMASLSNTSTIPLNHFFVHVPKAGGTYFLHQINDLWFTSKQYRTIKLELHSMEINQKYYYNQTLTLKPDNLKSLFRACAVISNNIQAFHNDQFPLRNNQSFLHQEKGDRCTQYCSSLKGIKCDMWISESVYDDKALTVWPQTTTTTTTTTTTQAEPSSQPKEKSTGPERTNVYTIVREPQSHLLSQYFHCKESVDHEYARDDMAGTLEEWIEYWSNRYQQYRTTGGGSSSPTLDDDDDNEMMTTTTTLLFNNTLRPNNVDIQWRKLMWKDPKYKCYVPVNFQSYVLQFYPPTSLLLSKSSRRSDSINSTIRTGTTNPVRGQDDDDDRRPSSIINLDHPSHVEEINKQIQKFNVIGIQSQMEKSLCLIAVKYIGKLPERCNCTDTTYTTHRTAYPNNGHRTLRLNDHGVKHHGDSYNVTREQRRVMNSIQQRDQLLYEYAQIIFDLQIYQVETTLQVKICDKLLPKYS